MRVNAWIVAPLGIFVACAQPAPVAPPRPPVVVAATPSPPSDAKSVILPTQAVPANAATREDAARATSLFVGRPAPEFTAIDAHGAPHALADHRGRFVVLRFFVAADLPDCVCDANAESDSLWRMQEIDADVLAVGPFAPAKAEALAHKYGLSFTLLCDADRALAQLYDAGDAPDAARQTFVIGPDGSIEAHWPTIVPQGHAARVKAWLDARRR
ncbi:MAG: redoxin domain-containing protein [Planctomycetes bacterium]|nr:redoxin domain-containing protein [Planctomycetota bacterium]MCC7170909.1 redoxin domain-containing protein [Planctomycetota bacterium]